MYVCMYLQVMREKEKKCLAPGVTTDLLCVKNYYFVCVCASN